MYVISKDHETGKYRSRYVRNSTPDYRGSLFLLNVMPGIAPQEEAHGFGCSVVLFAQKATMWAPDVERPKSLEKIVFHYDGFFLESDRDRARAPRIAFFPYLEMREDGTMWGVTVNDPLGVFAGTDTPATDSDKPRLAGTPLTDKSD